MSTNGVDDALELIRRVVGGELAYAEFEPAFLRIAKALPAVDDPKYQAVERAFFLVDGYDHTRTPKTETVHNLAPETVMTGLRGIVDGLSHVTLPDAD
jgi:hypothetical protein